MSAETELTTEQQEVLDQFRTKVSDILNPEDDDKYLLRWLKARKFNLGKAEEMLRKHMRYKKIYGLDGLLKDYKPPEFLKYFLTSLLGFDNEGSAVRLLNMGACDMKGLAVSATRTDAFLLSIYILETDKLKQLENKEKVGKINEKQVYIFDLKGLPWRQIICRPVIERTMVLLKMYEANYPESLKVVYIVNAPSFFSLIYRWLKKILPAEIMDKIQILEAEESSATFIKIMDPSILPSYLGGTKRDPDGDPTCPSMFQVPLGTRVPEELYLSSQMSNLSSDLNAKTTVVQNGASFILEVEVSTANSILEWDFLTKNNDIGFGLLYRKHEEDEPRTLIPIHRVDCHLYPETGRYDCEHQGIYELNFDNTFSWFNQKELIYKVEVKLPSDEN